MKSSKASKAEGRADTSLQGIGWGEWGAGKAANEAFPHPVEVEGIMPSPVWPEARTKAEGRVRAG